MESIADRLPPEIGRRINPGWRKNEADYWAQRNSLLAQYRGQWIGFAHGKVIAFGSSPVEVLHNAYRIAPDAFVTCVGREEEPCRIRRVSFSYDKSYSSEALPIMRAEFRPASGSPGILFEEVIPDTGADATALPWSDCEHLGLDPAKGIPGLIGGVGGSTAATVAFPAWVWLDGGELPCNLNADFVGQERILGRDVLNRVEMLFRGPTAEVVVNP